MKALLSFGKFNGLTLFADLNSLSLVGFDLLAARLQGQSHNDCASNFWSNILEYRNISITLDVFA